MCELNDLRRQRLRKYHTGSRIQLDADIMTHLFCTICGIPYSLCAPFETIDLTLCLIYTCRVNPSDRMNEKEGHPFPGSGKTQCKALITQNVNFLRALGVKSEHRTGCANNVYMYAFLHITKMLSCQGRRNCTLDNEDTDTRIFITTTMLLTVQSSESDVLVLCCFYSSQMIAIHYGSTLETLKKHDTSSLSF